MDVSDLRAFLHASRDCRGTGKNISIKMGGDKPDEVVATFRLPSDASQITPLVDACLQSMPAASPGRKAH